MEIFEYRETVVDGIKFDAWDVIQADVEDNLPLFLNKPAEEIKNIVIVGAWQGDEVRSFLRLPEARIFCFEPNPETFAILKNLYGEHKRVTAFPVACSSSNGRAKFFETDKDGNGSMLEIDQHFSAKQTESLEVTTVRLDTVKELSGPPIDLLWVDVQGFELEVLKGAENIFQNIQALFLEVSINGGGYKNAVKLSELDEFLLKHRFERIAQGLGTEPKEGNALFLKTGANLNALSNHKNITLRVQKALERRNQKRKVYSSPLFRILHRLTPQKVRTFFKKRLKNF